MKIKKNLDAIVEIGRVWRLLPKEAKKEIMQILGGEFRASRFSLPRLGVMALVSFIAILVGFFCSTPLFCLVSLFAGLVLYLLAFVDPDSVVLTKEGIALYYYLRTMEYEDSKGYQTIEKYFDVLLKGDPGIQLFAMLHMDKYFAEKESVWTPQHTQKVVDMANTGVAFLAK